MVDTALCILRHPQRVAGSRKPLEAADLTEKLMSNRYTLHQLQALESLYDGNDSGVVSTEGLADLQSMLYANPGQAPAQCLRHSHGECVLHCILGAAIGVHACPHRSDRPALCCCGLLTVLGALVLPECALF
jgi:hypothetical protein